MKKCACDNCENNTIFENGKSYGAIYCVKHAGRLRRNGYLSQKKEHTSEHGLENLPHDIVDDFIKKHSSSMMDKDIAKKLEEMNIATKVPVWDVRYRRRKLGLHKRKSGDMGNGYAREIGVKEYGHKCELCDYSLSVQVHHIKPKRHGLDNSLANLCVLCPNCHQLITDGIIEMNSRSEMDMCKAKREALLAQTAMLELT